MFRPSERSLRMALTALMLTVPSARTAPGQDKPPASTPAPDNDATKRVEELTRTIGRHLDAGRIAEATPPARDGLAPLERTRGNDHWQTGDARRELRTYQRLAELPDDARDRYVKARRVHAQARQHSDSDRPAEAEPLLREE